MVYSENRRIEDIIFENLIFNESYVRQVIPFLKEEYFHDLHDKILFHEIKEYINKYSSLPSKDSLTIDVKNLENITEENYKHISNKIQQYSSSADKKDFEWLVDSTEQFCKDQAIYNAISDSIFIVDGKDKKRTKHAIPELLSTALSISFDTNIGHDYLPDSEKRYEFYHVTEKKYPFDLSYLNQITDNGVTPKTLNIFLGGTNVGKSLVLCHFASHYLNCGYDVLYITMEMAEERIAERIDANLLDISISDLRILDKKTFLNKVESLRKKTQGNLIIKEYPTGAGNVSHFRRLLDELAIKKSYRPQLVFIDYLNICSSSKLSLDSSGGSYFYVKAISEELRGLAVEYNIPIFTASQLNRGGYNNSEPELTNISESFGTAATADLVVAIIRSEQLDQLGQIMIKQMKNRYSDTCQQKRGIIGVDMSKMRLFDIQESQTTMNHYEKDDEQDTFIPKQNRGVNKLNKDKFSRLVF